MTQRLRKLLILIVMALLALTLMAGSLLWNFTYARYAGGELDKDSAYDDDIEFVGANEYVVYSPEELVEAIENGYSYIQIGENAEEPFVIDTGVTDVTANLVIDLNGTTIVRNSRNPVLDVKRNVSAVLVYDSSQAQTGGFYNPVGSALQISGGTLTVADGVYASGPKSTVNSTLPAAGSAYLVTRDDRQSAYDSASKATGLPLLPEPAEGAIGVYLSSAPDANAGYNALIKADTYLLYTEEQNAYVDGNTLYIRSYGDNDEAIDTAFTTLCDVASCDFYYYYQIDAGEADDDYDQTYAVIYGYNDVKSLAENENETATALTNDGLVWPYAAVRSTRSAETAQTGEERAVGGEGYMRGGTFNTYFGTVNTYGIYAEGGTLNVSNSAVSFSAIEHGVCIHSENPSNASGDAAVLNISGGNFKSELGNTIEMNGGIMTVTAGTFNKDASSGATSEEIAANGSAIRVEGGSLTINGTQTGDTKSVIFNVTGNNVNGITSPEMTSGTPGTVNVTNASFTFNSGSDGTMNYGIAAAGGTISATRCTFTLPGDDNNGIVASGGQITASSSTFTLNGSRNNGIYSIVEGISSGETYFDAQATDCIFNITGSASHGVYASGGRTLVSGGSIAMKGSGDVNIGNSGTRGNDNFGIEVASGEVTANGCIITVTGTYSAGVLARGGTVNLGSISDGVKTTQTTINIYLSSATNETITTLSSSAVSSESAGGNEGIINITDDITIDSNSLGITARGTVNVNGGTATVKTLRATGVYVNNGTLSVAAGATLSVTSTIAQGCTWVQPPEGQTALPPSIYNGIYVNGGSLNSTGTLNVTFTGVENDRIINEASEGYYSENTNSQTGTSRIDVGSEANMNNYPIYESSVENYRNLQIKSYAVRVEGGTDTIVTIEKGKITNDIGGGVYVGGGQVTLGENGNNESLKVSATGDEVYQSLYAIGRTTWTTGLWPFERTHYGITLAPYLTLSDSTAANWGYMEPKTGGEAVKIVGGGLLVLGGTYSAAQGNGILVNGGTSTINGGAFTGNDNFTTEVGSSQAGPAASYAFKILNGTATVYNGTFGTTTGTGSGAFITGSSTSSATANIYGGSFVVSSGDSGGQAGVSVLKYATITFDETVPPDATLPFESSVSVATADIVVTGRAAGITVEQTLTGDSNAVLNIIGGTYQSTATSGNSDGIWYGNGTTQINIYSGRLVGKARSGIYFDSSPGSNVKIYGGTLEGNGAISGNNAGSITTGNIIARGSWCFDGSNNAICDENYSYVPAGNEYFQVGGGGEKQVGGDAEHYSVALNDTVYNLNGGNLGRFNSIGTIVVQTGLQLTNER